VELASCHPSGTWNFEVAPRFLESLCTPGVNRYVTRNPVTGKWDLSAAWSYTFFCAQMSNIIVEQ
jgi:hypothetical protein